jgi:hypothetical protein
MVVTSGPFTVFLEQMIMTILSIDFQENDRPHVYIAPCNLPAGNFWKKHAWKYATRRTWVDKV